MPSASTTFSGRRSASNRACSRAVSSGCRAAEPAGFAFRFVAAQLAATSKTRSSTRTLLA